MEWLAFVLAAGTSILLARKLRIKKKQLERYKPIVNIENYVSKIKQEIAGERSAWNSQRATERQKLDGDLAAIKLQLASSQSELSGLQKSIQDYQDQVDLLDSNVHLLECGYYEPEYNFEWADGYSPRFGLVEINYDTQARTVRNSARTYADIAKNNSLKGIK